MKLPVLFTKEVELAAKAHAAECYPEESCGLVVNNQYLPMKNCASDPLNDFLIDPVHLIDIEVQAIIHSHPDADPVPSSADMRGQIDSAVPWGIFTVKRDYFGECNFSPILWFGDQVPKLPLIGRPFVHGVTDCYAIIRDVYKEELGIELPDFPRDWDWWMNDQNLYTDGFSKAGFYEIQQHELKKYDVVLSSLGMRNGVANHGSIYYGDEMVLHHLAAKQSVDFTRVSTIVPAAPFLRRAVHFLRYKGLDE